MSPTGAELLHILIKLYAEQENVKIKYHIEKENKNGRID